MRILWIVNVVPPTLTTSINRPTEILGGWVESMSSVLSKKEEVKLGIACKCQEGLAFDNNVGGIKYYSVPYGKKTSIKGLTVRCREIIQSFDPEIVHIEGTEFIHARAMQLAAKEAGIPVVISLQGILDGYYPYQCGHLMIDDMMFSRSLTNISAAWILHLRKTRWFAKRLKPENDIISDAEFILGRTSWDRAHAYKINTKALYYNCNRNLRPPFYTENWSAEKREIHSLYVGNGYYALKGVHYVVQAVAQLRNEYPDIKVYVAGYKPFSEGDKRSFFKKGYGLYLKKLIGKLGVEDNIVFTGPLQANEVAERLSRVHAYILCSVIENSPNTLGEAMMVGTPCIASYVGGVPDMVTDGVEALLYRDDDPAMLAWRIKQLFDDDELCLRLSENAKKRAAKTHDLDGNADQLLKAYNEVLRKSHS